MSSDRTTGEGVKVKVVDSAGHPVPGAVVEFRGIWNGQQSSRGGGRTGSEGIQGLKGPPDDRVITVTVSLDKSKGWKQSFAWVDRRVYSISLEDVTLVPPVSPLIDTQVIILIHGIRDFGLWQNSVRRTFERHFAVVEATNFGRFDLLRFLLPISYFRRAAVREVWRQVRDIKRHNPQRKLSFVAHSFGTYVLAHILQEEFDFAAFRIIFCGSVLKYGFPFEQISERFRRPILNEVGAKDVWPAMAQSVTWGYGSAGTYGFNKSGVRDRWHSNAGHGYFLKPAFCERYWIPYFKDGTIVEGADEPEDPPVWVRILYIFRLKYLLLAALVALTWYYNRPLALIISSIFR
jgi:hypothetical protein